MRDSIENEKEKNENKNKNKIKATERHKTIA
jgi:hypothetical protein